MERRQNRKLILGRGCTGTSRHLQGGAETPAFLHRDEIQAGSPTFRIQSGNRSEGQSQGTEGTSQVNGSRRQNRIVRPGNGKTEFQIRFRTQEIRLDILLARMSADTGGLRDERSDEAELTRRRPINGTRESKGSLFRFADSAFRSKIRPYHFSFHP